MNAWRELVMDNPMMAEFYRRGRRFALSRNNQQNIIFAILGVVLVYVVCLMMFVQMSFLTATGVATAKFPLLLLVVPVAVHATVAGEREKLTWDALCSAPLTDAQIVAGKFVSSVAVVALVELVFLPVQLAAWTVRQSADRWVDLVSMVRMDGYCMAVGLALGCVTFLLSARSKRPFTTLGASIGLVAAGLTFGGVTLAGNPEDMARKAGWLLVSLLNHYVHLAAIISPQGSDNWVEKATSGIPFAPEIGAAFYVSVGLAALFFATKTLHHADQEAVASGTTKRNKHA